MKKLILIIIFITLLFIVNFVFADSKILINEFLIDPQPQSVEIFNSGTESADISDWIIDDSGGTTFYTIPKESVIFPNQCLVFSGDFNLNKSSADTVKLINNSITLDLFSYKSSSGSGISYLRIPDGSDNWTTGSANLGFYNSSPEQTCLFPTLTSTPTLTPTLPAVVLTEAGPVASPTSGPEPTAEAGTNFDNIYLSEVMANPQTGEKEWVEIYNNNNFLVSLNNWHIDDLENSGSSPKIFSLEINAKSYAVYDLTSSMFNNDGDTVRLLDFNKNLKDNFEYQKTEQGKTLGRISFDSDNFCIQEPSKNSVDNPCINLSPTPIASPESTAEAGPTLPNILQTKVSLKIQSTPIIKPKISNQLISPRIDFGQVLGTSDKIIINTPNNKPLINFLSSLSCLYSLLTIISILFKMKLSYGKDKKFYSPSLRSS